jgi:hypothetical protein
MSTRDREPDTGPLKYAPKWARSVGPEEAAKRNRPRRPPAEPVPLRAVQLSPPPVPQASRASPSSLPPPSSRPREAPPPRQGRAPRGAFEGDVAIRELRQRMALAPDLPPTPPLRRDRGVALGMMLRLGGLVTVAAIVACAIVWISTPRPQAADTVSPGNQSIAGSGEPDPAPAGETNPGTSPAAFRPPTFPPGTEPGVSPASEKASPTDLPRRPSASPWPLPDRRGDGAPSSVSPTTGTAVPLPAAGPQRPAAAPGADREEVAALIARGQTYLANGDVVSARLVFRRAAEAGDAQSALALGGTYDPLVLRSLGVIGVAADAAQARNWYRKAAELGSREAPQRIDQLAQWAR